MPPPGITFFSIMGHSCETPVTTHSYTGTPWRGRPRSQVSKRSCWGRDTWGSAVPQQVSGTVTVMPVKQGTKDEQSNVKTVTTFPGEIPGSLLPSSLLLSQRCCLLSGLPASSFAVP